MIPKWLTPYLATSGLEKIEQAVAKAEKKTMGEIVPLVVQRSSAVGVLPLVLSLIFIVFYLLLVLICGLEHIGFSPWLLHAAVLIVSIVLPRYLAGVAFVQRWLIPKEDQQSQVIARAELEFFEARTNKTERATGILIMVSLMEHRAVVLADQAIAEKVDSNTWQEVVDVLIKNIKIDDLAQGFVDGIELCTQLLAKHFPAENENKNELCNKLIIRDF